MVDSLAITLKAVINWSFVHYNDGSTEAILNGRLFHKDGLMQKNALLTASSYGMTEPSSSHFPLNATIIDVEIGKQNSLI